MAEIRHFENRHDVIISADGWSDLDNDMSTAVIWSKSKSGVEFQYGMLSQIELPATLQGAAT